MYYRVKNSILTMACLMTLTLAPGAMMKISATEADNTAAIIAERGGGGGRGGGGEFHGSEGHEGMQSHPAARDDYNHSNYNHQNYNRNDYNRDQFNRDNNWNRNDWNGADWNAGWGGVDVVPQGEYVAPVVVPDQADTLYQYENSSPNNPGN